MELFSKFKRRNKVTIPDGYFICSGCLGIHPSEDLIKRQNMPFKRKCYRHFQRLGLAKRKCKKLADELYLESSLFWVQKAFETEDKQELTLSPYEEFAFKEMGLLTFERIAPDAVLITFEIKHGKTFLYNTKNISPENLVMELYKNGLKVKLAAMVQKEKLTRG